MVCKTLFDSQWPLAKSVVFTFGLLPIHTGDNVLLRRFDQGPDLCPKKDMARIWLHHLEHIPEVVKDPYVSSVKDNDPTKLIPAKGRWRIPLLHLLQHAKLITVWAHSGVRWGRRQICQGCIFWGAEVTTQVECIEVNRWDISSWMAEYASLHDIWAWSSSGTLIIEGGGGSGGWSVYCVCVGMGRELLAETYERRPKW